MTITTYREMNNQIVGILRTGGASSQYAARRIEELEAEVKRLRTALQRSPYDISPCGECGKPVVCVPEGLALCEQCAEAADKVRESELSDESNRN